MGRPPTDPAPAAAELPLPARRRRGRAHAQVARAAACGVAVERRPARGGEVAVERGLADTAGYGVVGAAHPRLEVAAARDGGRVGPVNGGANLGMWSCGGAGCVGKGGGGWAGEASGGLG